MRTVSATGISRTTLYGFSFRIVRSPSPADRRADICIEQVAQPISGGATWLTRGSRWVPRIGLLGASYVLRLRGVAEFLVSEDGHHLRAYVDPDADPHILAWFVCRGVVPRVLQIRGVPCLHASGAAAPEGIAGFAGPSGSGKSTVVAALAQRGFRVVGDDVLPIRVVDGVPMGGPGLEEVSLYPATARRLGLEDEVRRGRPPASKAMWVPRPSQKLTEPAPVRVVYLLRLVQPGSPPSPAARRGPIQSQARAFRALMQGSMWTHRGDSRSLARVVPEFAAIARSVVVRRLSVRLDARGLDTAAAIVRDELARLS